MISCVIVEDDHISREALTKTIELHFTLELELLGSAGTLAKGIDLISQKNPDLVFLDIDLPDENGLNLFNYFSPTLFEVIFTTSNQDYAIKAIKSPCVDFLLKPLTQSDIRTALIKYGNSRQQKMMQQQLRQALDNLQMGRPFSQKITFPVIEGFQVFHTNDIIFCQASENYAYINTITGERFLVTKTLKIIEDQLPNDIFYRIHKSTLVNINYVKSFVKKDGDCKLMLETGHKLEVAARRQDDFTALFLRRSTLIDSNKISSN